jgi:hypothetical protein
MPECQSGVSSAKWLNFLRNRWLSFLRNKWLNLLRNEWLSLVRYTQDIQEGKFVSYYLKKSFDKKKNKESQEAIEIVIIK